MAKAPFVECRDLIGTPFEYGGRGPDAFDCYGLLMEMHRRQGIDITDYGSSEHGVEIIAMMLGRLDDWKQISKQPGATILIKLPMSMHVGFLLPHNKFIHTTKSTGGVTIERLKDWERRVLGYYEPM